MLGRVLVSTLALLLAAIVIGGLALQSSWGKERIRRLIVSQAARVLNGTLDIGRIDGSILGGITLVDVRLQQDDVAVIRIARAEVDYGIRELYQGGTFIRRLRLERLHVVGAKDRAGRWNLGQLIRPRPPRPPSGAPPRLIGFDRVELVDATVEFADPLFFGAARVSSRFDDLDAVFAFELRGPAWSLSFDRASWTGRDPDLTIGRLAGGIATDATGWTFTQLRVESARSAFTVDGAVRRQPAPTVLALEVAADRFAFQEWGGMLGGLRNIAVEAAFTTHLDGPLGRLATTLDLRSTGGAVRGDFVLDSTVPGWHGSGTADVTRLDVAHWFNRPDRRSDVTGRIEFDLDLDLGRRFPRGTYRFSGRHAAYIGYEADNVIAAGTLTATEAVIAAATATAYGADVRVRSGAIAIDAPYRYRFAGRAAGLDLRRVPREVPVPHVDSTLVLDYDVHGQFAPGYIIGEATFGSSEFLGAQIAAGAFGSIDTSATPVHYSGEGTMTGISLRRFGDGLDVAWMREARYDGIIAGRFHVDATGSGAAGLVLDGGGRLSQAHIFQGRLHDADVTVHLEDGSLRGSYDGAFERINPARATGDDRLVASLTGAGRATFAVAGLLTRAVALADYSVAATATLRDSVIRMVDVDRAAVEFGLADEVLTLTTLDLRGPLLEATARGVVPLDDVRSSDVDFDLLRGDLALVRQSAGGRLAGAVTSQGHLSGPLSELRVTGDARISRLTAAGLEILTGGAAYDATLRPAHLEQTVARVSGTVGPLTISGQAINEISGNAALDGQRLTIDLRGTRAGGLNGSVGMVLRVSTAARQIDVSALDVVVQDVAWRAAVATPPGLRWDDDGVTIRELILTDVATAAQRVTISGEWRSGTTSGLRVRAAAVDIDNVSGAFAQPPRYGGRLNADAVIRPASGAGNAIVTGTFTVTDGRIRRLAYDRLAATIGYDDGQFAVDARLDQRPGVWITAQGRVPLGVLVDGQPDLPMQLAIASSQIDVGILEGLTDTVRDVRGTMQLQVDVVGTANDPHFDGFVDITNAGFVVSRTGAAYQNTRMAVALARDQVTVKALHVEDRRGHALDVTGSLATHELRVGDFAVTARARQFEVMRNEFGTTEVDADLDLQGRFESPRLAGTIAITGGDLNVDEILDRALLRPYATEAAAPAAADSGIEVDPLVVLNPWERLGIDLTVSTRGTLRMVGDNVQVSTGTPLGLGNVNVRAYGEVYLYKDPAQPLFVTGSLDSLTGTYAFQGRRFDLDPASSINFRGDLNPELYVTVRRTISAVETRVSIVGPLTEPELRLSSTPALDDSNILALIVFNTTLNELNAVQQQELAVRAGTLAAGFLATPLVTALERSLGLDILEIELQPSGAAGTTASPRVTVGDEIAPGLVARFSRQFGANDYSEATIEYYLSRLFRIRATFSDAGIVAPTSRLRRVERIGIDLLVFFSF